VSDIKNLIPLMAHAKKQDELDAFTRIEKQSQKNSLYTTTKMLPSEILMEIMISCHSLNFIKNKLIGNFILIIFDKYSKSR